MPRHGRRHGARHGRFWPGPGRPLIPRFVEYRYYGVVYVPVEREDASLPQEVVVLYEDEVEAFRLAYLEGLSVRDASAKMGVSEATFWRILNSGRRKLAEAIFYRRPFKIVERPVE
ncbi:hypothetical protein TCELL_0956 [Thermogladius calderae 1633]|uniref:DUF134 domain-containing protein n=1 Tax=Thermogladius calderae (strain DSM 22663 / VKM B-2946 / 1633) TaxID=1184251 RepID=I3TF41_THEC1|nr:DUF134 domain-containing protein [Thermogladius calderae]AFK51379.1 hypothetical protein TCELL_0956 [Thermogladius calderae 1633]